MKDMLMVHYVSSHSYPTFLQIK